MKRKFLLHSIKAMLFCLLALPGTTSLNAQCPAGTTWTSRTSAADNLWLSVTYGNGLFVAVSGNGNGNRVMTSPDGIIWTSRTSAADNFWTSVTYGNGLFVAVATTGTGNRVMTSPDGITWTSRTSAADNAWYSVTYGNGLFVAVSYDGTGNRVMTSPNGITWTSRTSAADNAWYSVTYGNGLFVAVAASGTGNRVMTSHDGITWTIRNSAANNGWISVTYGNGLFVAVSLDGTGNKVMTSPDGITWTSRTSAEDNTWYSVTYGNGVFVAVAAAGSVNRVMTSPDGITWTIRTSAADNSWVSVTYGNGLFVAVANTGIGNRVMTSSQLLVTPSVTIAANPGNSITTGTSVTFTATPTNGGSTPAYQWKKNNNDVGTNSAIYTDAALQNGDIITCVLTSSNPCASPATATSSFITMAVKDPCLAGIIWTSQTTVAGIGFYSVTYGNGLFVAVGTGGNSVNTSPDGITWTSRTSAASNQWRSVTYGNGLFVAVAATGTGNRVMTSPDGITWTSRTSAADNLWYSVTYGNGVFVAVAATGTGNRVMTSPDGITWTSRTSAADNGWFSVTYGNGLFVAVAASGIGNRVMTSPDGITWTSRTSPANNGWTSVTYGNGVFVAVSYDGTGNRVITSPNGITWTSRTSAADNFWRSVTYGNGLFVAVASTGTGNRVMTSPDGITWTSRTSAADKEWYSVTYGNGLLVAVASNSISNSVMTSSEFVTPSVTIAANLGNSITTGNSVTFTATPTNGGSTPAYQWKKNSNNVGSNSATYTDAALQNGDIITCVLTSNANCASPATATSNGISMTVDLCIFGTTWTSRTPASNNAWFSVTYGNGLFVAVANNAPIGAGNRVMTSPDGITWTSRTSAADNQWTSVTYGNGLFVAVANTGIGNRVMTSPDGITWTSRTSAADNQWFSVTYGNGLFVAVAIDGTGNRVMTSPDGITWTSRTSATNDLWRSVTYGNGLFVAVAYFGTATNVMTSPDGITWTSRTPATVNAWYSVTYGNSLFVAVAGSGTGNRVMTSPDGITWTSRTSAADNSWYSVTYGNGVFVAVATNGTGNRVMRSSGFVSPSVTIAANPGNSITTGTSVTFTATPTNGGSTPAYQWNKNNNNVGSNSAIYTDAGLQNGDFITCILTSNANCASPFTVSSTGITMSVTNPCSPTASTFTVTACSSYTWAAKGNKVYTASNTTDTIKLINAAGCDSVVTLNLTINAVPATPTISAGGATTFCTGGSVILSSSSASGNQWYVDGNIMNGETNQDYTATASGTYTVVVSDNGCSSSPSPGSVVFVNVIPSTPTISAGGATTFCTGGSVVLSSSSAIGNQWYVGGSLINGAADQTYTATASGTYTVVVMNSNGCSSDTSAPITVTVLANNIAGTASAVPAVCINTPLTAITHATIGATGISDDGVKGANGLPAGVSATWSGNTITISGTPTASGTFNYRIPLTGGCSIVNATGTIIVNANTTSDTTASACNSFTWKGTIYKVSGDYVWNTTNEAGCDSAITLHLTILSVSSTIAKTDALCANAANGTITVTPTSGVSPYTYRIGTTSSFGVFNTFTGLRAGNYRVSILDANGCAGISDQVIILQPPALTATTAKTDAVCNGSATGSIITTPTSGIAPFSFRLGTLGTYGASNTFNNLKAGNYTVYILDANSCPGTATAVINQSPLITGTTTTTPVLCNGGSTGSITVTPTNGVAPHTYRYGTTGAYVSSNVFTNVKGGSPRIFIQDANSCIGSVIATVLQPNKIAATATVVNETCPNAKNGSITINPTGGTSPYAYRLGTTGSFGINNTFSNLKAGNYRVFVNDANGCSGYSILTTVGQTLPTCPIAKRNITAKTDIAATPQQGLAVQLTPNPSNSYFTLRVKATTQEVIQVRVIDVNGRSLFTAKGLPEQVFQFGESFAGGVYMIEVRQGDEVKTVKAVKMR